MDIGHRPLSIGSGDQVLTADVLPNPVESNGEDMQFFKPVFRNPYLKILCLVGSILLSRNLRAITVETKVDVVVYGATPAGVAAALCAAEDGCDVLLVEPTRRIGGLITCGLSHTDFHSFESLSGSYLKFAERVQSFYAEKYGSDSQQVTASFRGTFAEPKVNLLVMQKLIEEQSRIKLATQHTLQGVGVSMVDTTQKSVRSIMLRDPQGSQIRVNCSVAIDASYEGDLMAMVGVPWKVGREGQKEYGETLAPAEEDKQLQAYNFRFVMTNDPANRVRPIAPAGYRREDFVGVLDALSSGKIKKVFGYPSACIFKAQEPPLPNGKWDINDVSRSLVRLSLPGSNLKWPDGNPEMRREIFAEHLTDNCGLLYFLQNDESVPDVFRKEALEWGWCRDEFEETEHLPPQLYVREARRMVGQHVYRQQDSEHAPNDARAVFHPDSIAMADYGNNCHGTEHEGPRFGGKHTGEFYNPVPPYQIPYGVVVPCEVNNLLVPTAVSSTHVGFCALRLEPIWMSLGQACGYAAAQSLHKRLSVQKIAVRELQHRLHRAGAATIYVSDVLPHTPDFQSVQWWGSVGGLHGLSPMPTKPGARGKNIHGQYFEANPGHTADLDSPMDQPLKKRWMALAILAGLESSQVEPLAISSTRGEFIRRVYALAVQVGLVHSQQRIPPVHISALPNLHPPGEVDRIELVSSVVSDPDLLPGIVVDDSEASLVGAWQYSTHTPPYVGRGYLHDLKEDKGTKWATFTPTIPNDGLYEVRMSHCYNIRRATNTVVIVHHADGEARLVINQQEAPEHAGLFRSLGKYRFLKGREGFVRVVNDGTPGKVAIADAMQFLEVK